MIRRPLILGAGGQLGRALRASAPEGAAVLAPTRGDLDIRDVAAIRAAVAAHRPDAILNAAAYTDVDRAEAEPGLAAAINAEAVGRLAAAAQDAGAAFLHASTDFVFDGASGTPYAPGAPTAPLGAYGRSKRDGENAALAAHPRAIVLRTAWLHAGSGRNFVRTMLRLMRAGSEVRVVADQVGTPTRAAHLAAACWTLLASGAAGIHHFTDAGVASWYDFAVAIGEEAAALAIIAAVPRVVPIASVEFPTAARRPAFSVLDKRATWALLGAPPPHWREGLRATLREIARDG